MTQLLFYGQVQIYHPNFHIFLPGGRDTAGLGGKGGPYRLDAGHTVYQVSQAEKDAVPEEVKRAAREMGQRAFQQRSVFPSRLEQHYCYGEMSRWTVGKPRFVCVSTSCCNSDLKLKSTDIPIPN